MARKLLLADDSVTIQKVVGISFANEDIELVTVDNGDDALERVQDSPPDIVLADVVMPGRTGYEVCEAIKNNPQLAHIPVLLLTGTFEAFDEERARRVQADGHITKPFEAQSLVDQVNRLLSRARPAAAPAPEVDIAPAPTSVEATPARAAAATPADEEAFDFFEDDFGTAPDLEPQPAAAARNTNLELQTPAPQESTQTPSTTAFEVDAGESGFDFAPVVEEPVPAPAPGPSDAPTELAPPARPAADATVALMDSPADAGWPSSEDVESAFDEDTLERRTPAATPDAPLGDATPPAEPLPLSLEPPLARVDDAQAAGDELDFGFESEGEPEQADPLGAFDAPDAARETLLDPDADDAFAVSSSDLGEPLEAPVAASASEEPPAAPMSDFFAAPEPEPEPMALPEPEAERSSALEEPEPLELTEVTPAPADAPELPIVELSEPDPMGLPEPEPAAAPAAEPAGTGAMPDLTPMMRERVHDSLEKIAWEAFADLPETIVRQAIAKVEEIAWEVIPQMAEALVQEEIRRMKGESE